MNESRRTWPTPMSTAGVGEGHTHELPSDLVELIQSLHQRVRRGTTINVVNLVFVLAMIVFLVLFIIDRGEQRDAAEQRMRDEIHNGQCELLDAFPQAPLLDEVRRRFDCGPGLPPDAFPPEVQQELNGAPPVKVPAAPDGVESSPEGFTFSDGAYPNVQPQQPYFPTPGVAEPPATVPYPEGFPPPDPVQPTPPPLVDLSRSPTRSVTPSASASSGRSPDNGARRLPSSGLPRTDRRPAPSRPGSTSHAARAASPSSARVARRGAASGARRHA